MENNHTYTAKEDARYKIRATADHSVVVVDTHHPEYKDGASFSITTQDLCVMAHWISYPVPNQKGDIVYEMETQDTAQAKYLLYTLNLLYDSVQQIARVNKEITTRIIEFLEKDNQK